VAAILGVGVRGGTAAAAEGGLIFKVTGACGVVAEVDEGVRGGIFVFIDGGGG